MVGITVGVAGLIISIRRRKNGKSSSGQLSGISAFALSIGIISIVYLSVIVIKNITPPENFVETDILIQEDGYQDTRFTANGMVYGALDIRMLDVNRIGDPIFTYKTDGFLNGSQCGNYYVVENDPGFHLVSNEYGKLFALVAERERINAYYSDVNNLCGYYYDLADSCERDMSSDELNTIYNFVKKELNSLPITQKISDKDHDWLDISIICKDRLVYVDTYAFVKLDNIWCYSHGGAFLKDGRCEYIVTELPENIAELIIEWKKSN